MSLVKMAGRYSLGVESLAIDPTLQNSQTLFRSTIHEALERGANSWDLESLRLKYLWMRHTEKSEVAPAEEAFQDPEDLWTRLVVAEENTRFDSIIQQEMQQISFASATQGSAEVREGKYPGPVQDSDEYQHKIRPLYYSYGYTHPADFLAKQVEFTLFGKAKLKTWIHEDLAHILVKTPRVLDGWSAGLAEMTAKGIDSVNGLQIREVKGNKVLSNHAFGCAIDVNALANPHVVGPAVIEVFNSVVKQAGVQFDFGKPVLGEHAMDIVSKPSSGAGHGKYTADDIMEMQNRAIPASDAVKAWLQANLPRYRQIMGKVQIAEKQLGIQNVKPSTSLKDRFKAAEAARNRLAHQRQEKQKGKPIPVYSEDNVAPPPETYREEEAFEEIESAFAGITSDPELSRIQTLYENFDTSYINTWEKQGVMSIPLYFAAALVGEQNLQWGEQYESSKDAMHFELVDGPTKPHVKADAPLSRGEQTRTLKKLMDESFPAKTPKFHF